MEHTPRTRGRLALVVVAVVALAALLASAGGASWWVLRARRPGETLAFTCVRLRATLLDDLDATYVLGCWLRDGEGVQGDRAAGEAFVRVAAARGHWSARRELARAAYREGRWWVSCPPKRDAGVHGRAAFLDAVSHGERRAYGWLYVIDATSGRQEQAMEWLRRGAALGDRMSLERLAQELEELDPVGAAELKRRLEAEAPPPWSPDED